MEIKQSEFRQKHLELSDVWTWSADLHLSEDILVALPLTEEALATADSLMIRSRFTTAAGHALEGLVVCAAGSGEVFALEVLMGDKAFTFNRLLLAPSHDELRRLAAELGEDAAQLLPISYSIVPSGLALSSGEFTF